MCCSPWGLKESDTTERLKWTELNERNQRWHKQIERYSMFLGRKSQYCENEYTTKHNQQIQCNPYQITNCIFTELEQKISWFIWKYKRTWIAKAVLRKKNGAGGINFPDFRLYYKATVVKKVWYWHKNRNINSKWNNWQRINFQNIQSAHTTQYQKNKQPNQKVGKRHKQT